MVQKQVRDEAKGLNPIYVKFLVGSLSKERDTHIPRIAIDYRSGKLIEVNTGGDQPSHAGLGNGHGEDFTRAGVDPDSECEDVPIRSEDIEPIGMRIGGRIAVGRGRHDEYAVTLVHFLSPYRSVPRQETARILDGRIVAKDLQDDLM